MTEQSGLDESTTDRRPLWVVMEIAVGRDCPLVGIDEPIHDIDVQQVGSVCRSEAVVGNGDDVEVHHMERQMDEECVANVFYDYDCVPHITDAKDDSLVVTVHPSDRSQITDIVTGLEESGYRAQVKRIVRLNEDLLDLPPVLCDFGLLTDKQQEALILAVDMGYYAQPRETTLEELADLLDIGKSAVSHRLKAAEAKVIRNHLPRTSDL